VVLTRRLIPLVLFHLVACGARTEIGGQAAQDAGATLSPCHAGDAPRVVVSAIPDIDLNGMATDGQRLYVAQSVKPLLWSVPVGGGEIVPLYGGDYPYSISASVPWPMLAADGGIYFDAFDGSDDLTWVSNVGGNAKTVASNAVSFFDWTQPRGFTWSGGLYSGSLSTVSFDGTVQPFLTIPDVPPSFEIVAILGTRHFIHVALIDLSSSPFAYSDRRFDIQTGTLHDEVALDASNSQMFMGPGAICVLAANASGISCLSDDQSAVMHIATKTGPFPRYIDDDWVYAAVTHDGTTEDFSRYSLVDGHEQQLMAGVYPEAVTSFGDCVYAALIKGTSPPATEDIWRLTP
jgi:hypothetical protein